MNVFLTGNIQVGKSTAIRKFLKNNDIRPFGFMTELNRDTGILMMKIISNDGEKAFQVAASNGPMQRPVPDIDAFDRAGELLTGMDTSECDMLIMDELGYMERNATVFRAAVSELLDRGIKTVGVLRNKPEGPFWEMLHERRDTVILTVDEENRDDIPDIIAGYMK